MTDSVGVMPSRRVRAVGRVALVGLVVGTMASCSLPSDGVKASPNPSRVGTPTAQTGTVKELPLPLLAWTSGGLPAHFGEDLARVGGVQSVGVFVGGMSWLTSTHAPSGEALERTRPGMGIPIDVGGSSPTTLRTFLPPSSSRFVPSLAEGEALLGRTANDFRQLSPGDMLVFEGRPVEVAGIVPDEDIGGHEVFVSRATATALGAGHELYALVEPATSVSTERLAARIRALAPSTAVRVRGPGGISYLRQADAVAPPVILKSVFGEFQASPHVGPDGSLTIDPSWTRANVVEATVPILGRVTCNRVLVPQLRAALTEVERRGFAKLVNEAEYGGCFSARLIRGASSAISTHTWGAAVDLNVSSNLLSAEPRQDDRLVSIFGRWGFAWGGNFLVPDGMHFQFDCFPRPLDPDSSPVCPPGGSHWPRD